MPIWAWVCIGLVLLVIAFLAYAGLADYLEEKRYEREATSVVGWIVQANTEIYSPGEGTGTAQILVCFDSPETELDEQIAKLAQRMAELKGRRLCDPVEAEVVELVNDERCRLFQRFRLPDAFTGGREVYSMHIWIERRKLPGKALSLPFVRCLAYPDRPNTHPRMTHYRDEDFDQAERDSEPRPLRPWER